DFDKQLAEAGSKLVVVDFYATWCGPCKTISPKIEAMSAELSDVVFIKVDVDECEDVSLAYQISCMPTFMFFRNSAKVESFSGANEAKLREVIMKLAKA
ncbi:UNVERIFIED_CONTAM: hypothetical protein GTU68_005729, partial [Idotea baltica]|nr:hypothetical protein [Idotea baltica]